MKETKPRPMVVFGVVLLFIGIAMVAYSPVSNWVVTQRMKREMEAYNEVTGMAEVDYSADWRDAEAYNRWLLEKRSQLLLEEGERERVEHLLNPNGVSVLGYLSVPAIDVSLPIYRGIEERQLQSGAGWWIGSSLPTGGEGTHCVITAHSGLAKAKLFTDLDKLTSGDRFTVTVLDRSLTYEVDRVLVIEPTDVSELLVEEGSDYVTLYTCTPFGVNSHRLLVRGVRVEDDSEVEQGPSEESVAEKTKSIVENMYIIMGELGLFCAVALLGVYVKRRITRIS